jgi:glucose-1-phosphate adenylyltransferase
MQRRNSTQGHVQTLILAGGVGERLRPLTNGRAKPLVPFGGRFRLIDFTLSNCFNSGLKRAYLLTQYDAESICKYARTITWFDELHCLAPQANQSYLGTADAVRRNAARLLKDECDHVLILGADHIYKMDYRRLLDFHCASGADATIACVENPRYLSSDFGVLEVDGRNRVVSFTEKPAYPTSLPSDPTMSLVSMGVYVFNKKALWQALEGGANDFGRDIASQLAPSGRLYSYNFTASQPGRAYWRDVGTIDSYYQTQMEVLQNASLMSLDPTHYWPIYSPLRSPETLPETTGVAASVVSEKAFVSPLAMVRKSIVLDGARVGSGARVQNAIVLEGASVPPNTNIGFNRQTDGSRFQITNRGVIIVNKEAANRPTGESQRRLSLAHAG